MLAHGSEAVKAHISLADTLSFLEKHIYLFFYQRANYIPTTGAAGIK
jgi:hypothetical protein